MGLRMTPTRVRVLVAVAWLFHVAPAFASEEERREARNAIWVQPAWVPFLAATGSVLVPLGAQFHLKDNFSLAAEASYLSLDKDESSVFASLGPLIRLAGPGETSGLFVQPKVLTVYEWGWGGRGVRLLGALDVGVQVTVRHFFIAAAVGAGAGYAFNCRDSLWAGVFGVRKAGRRSNRFDYELNVNLLRIGYAF